MNRPVTAVILSCWEQPRVAVCTSIGQNADREVNTMNIHLTIVTRHVGFSVRTPQTWRRRQVPLIEQ